MNVAGNEQSENESKTPNLVAPIALTAILIFVSALTIVIATSWLWDLPWGNGTRQIVLSIFNGMLFSLPVLISLWLVLGRQTWIIRIPLATLSLLALLGVYLATINSQSSLIPGEVFWMFGGIALAVFVTAQIPLWIIRVWHGASISRTGSNSIAKTQFTIKHLLITTTIFALLVTLLQWFATFESFSNPVMPMPLNQVFGFCGVFIVVLAFLTLLTVLFVFSPKLRVTCLCILLIGIAALPFAVVPSIIYVIGRTYTEADLMDTGINVWVFSTSNAVTMIAVLSMYYALGFRLRSKLNTNADRVIAGFVVGCCPKNASADWVEAQPVFDESTDDLLHEQPHTDTIDRTSC